jgi:hypothetical protein
LKKWQQPANILRIENKEKIKVDLEKTWVVRAAELKPMQNFTL